MDCVARTWGRGRGPRVTCLKSASKGGKCGFGWSLSFVLIALPAFTCPVTTRLRSGSSSSSSPVREQAAGGACHAVRADQSKVTLNIGLTLRRPSVSHRVSCK